MPGSDRHPEEYESDNESDGNCTDTVIDIACQLGNEADNHGAHKGSTLSADIHDTKIFT